MISDPLSNLNHNVVEATDRLPALIAGLEIGDLPDFIVGDALTSEQLEAVLAD